MIFDSEYILCKLTHYSVENCKTKVTDSYQITRRFSMYDNVYLSDFNNVEEIALTFNGNITHEFKFSSSYPKHIYLPCIPMFRLPCCQVYLHIKKINENLESSVTLNFDAIWINIWNHARDVPSILCFDVNDKYIFIGDEFTIGTCEYKRKLSSTKFGFVKPFIMRFLQLEKKSTIFEPLLLKDIFSFLHHPSKKEKKKKLIRTDFSLIFPLIQRFSPSYFSLFDPHLIKEILNFYIPKRKEDLLYYIYCK